MEGVSLILIRSAAGCCRASIQAAPGPKARFSRYLGMGGRQAAMAMRFANDRAITSAEKFAAIAEEAGMSPVTMAVALWSKQLFVASTIVGVTGMGQLRENPRRCRHGPARRGGEGDQQGQPRNPLSDGLRRPCP